MAAAASAFTGFSRWGYALAEQTSGHNHSSEGAAAVAGSATRGVYRPQFFSAPQYSTLETLTELILPAMPDGAKKGDGLAVMLPGAKDAGVAEFIDFMVLSDTTLQAPFVSGLAWLDHVAAPAESFSVLPEAKQAAILERIAYQAKYQPGEKAGQEFFLLLRRYTVMGFYTTRIGLESLDYPGLRFYASSPGCTHAGNPEHVGL